MSRHGMRNGRSGASWGGVFIQSRGHGDSILRVQNRLGGLWSACKPSRSGAEHEENRRTHLGPGHCGAVQPVGRGGWRCTSGSNAIQPNLRRLPSGRGVRAGGVRATTQRHYRAPGRQHDGLPVLRRDEIIGRRLDPRNPGRVHRKSQRRGLRNPDDFLGDQRSGKDRKPAGLPADVSAVVIEARWSGSTASL